MLKRSTKIIVFDMTEERRKAIEGVLYIVDRTIETQYYKIFYQMYLNQIKMNLEQLATFCNISQHTLLNNMDIVNKFIWNIIYFEEKNIY